MGIDLASVCVCPACRSTLAWSDELVTCTSCNATYPVERGVAILLPAGLAPAELEERWYPGARRLLPPWLERRVGPHLGRLRPTLTHKSKHGLEAPRRFAASFPPDAVVANVGAGTTSYGPNVLNLEIAPGPGVHVVGVAERLPLADASCAGLILMAVLEHVRDAEQTIAEARRVLAPGGRMLVDVPFIQGYHPSPGDYRRFTEQGLRDEIGRRGFTVEESGVAVGPGSAAAWVASEFLALLVSGRSASGYRLAKLVTSWIAAPLKYADAWLESHPMAYTIPSAVWAIARRDEG